MKYFQEPTALCNKGNPFRLRSAEDGGAGAGKQRGGGGGGEGRGGGGPWHAAQSPRHSHTGVSPRLAEPKPLPSPPGPESGADQLPRDARGAGRTAGPPGGVFPKVHGIRPLKWFIVLYSCNKST